MLVSLLEPGELANTGIVDVHRCHPRCMWCGRRSSFHHHAAAQRGDEVALIKSELALVKAQNLDITKFESQLDGSKPRLGATGALASDGFEKPSNLTRNHQGPGKPRRSAAQSRRTTCAWPTTRPKTSAIKEADPRQPDDGGQVCGAEAAQISDSAVMLACRGGWWVTAFPGGWSCFCFDSCWRLLNKR